MAKVLSAILLGASWAASASANDLPEWARSTSESEREALVIGVAEYDNVADLTTPANDADRVSEKLIALGFNVSRPTGVQDRAAILSSVLSYLDALQPGNLALVYYSGHGVERDGTNYLIPSDVPAKLIPGREGHQAIALDWIMNELRQREPGLSIIILDACRDDPFFASDAPALAGKKGLAQPLEPPSGVFIGFAAGPGKASWSRFEGDSADLPSIFTRRLTAEIEKPGRSLYSLWNVVGRQVFSMTGEQQRPWHNASLFPELKLVPDDYDLAEEENAWQNAVLSSSPATLRADLVAFLDYYPVSRFAATARRKIAEIDGQADAWALDLLTLLRTQFANLLPGDGMVSAGFTGSVSTAVRSEQALYVQAGFSDAVAASVGTHFVRSAPSQAAPSIAVLSTGTPVAVLETPSGNGSWGKVLLPSGVTGWLQGVKPLAQSPQGVENLFFHPGAVEAVNREKTKALVGRLAGSSDRLSIKIGPPTGVLEDRDRKLAYLRALAVRGELIRNGLSVNRIDVAFAVDDDLPPDTAKLSILQLRESNQ